MKKEKKVSVIIPTYKRADYICRAIDSVLNQTYSNIEIIVVDDNDSNSNDRNRMEKIMEKYKNNKQVLYIKHKKNMNGSTARNTGIKKSSGEFITFLDDDDFYLKNRVRSLVDLLDNSNTYSAAYTGLIRITNEKIVNLYDANLEGNLEEELLNLNSFFKSGSNLFFKKEVFDKIKGFDTEFKRHQDIEFMARFFQYFKIKKLNEYLVVKDDSSRINYPNIELSLSSKDLFIKKFESRLEKYNKNSIITSIYQQVFNVCKHDDKNYKNVYNKINRFKPKSKIYFDKIIYVIKHCFLRKIYDYTSIKTKCIFLSKNIKEEIKLILTDYKNV